MADAKTDIADVNIRSDLEALKKDLLSVKDDLRKMTAAAVGEGREKAGAVKEKAVHEVEQGLECARGYVQERPITCALVALGVGVVMGTMLRHH